MSDELKFLAKQTAKGTLSRRSFLGRASALGIAAATANTLLADAAKAAGPVRGGHLKIGSLGGESTNTLDPALSSSQVPYYNARQFGDTLVDVSPDGEITNRLAETVEASADAKTWHFKDPQWCRVSQRAGFDGRRCACHDAAPF